MFRIAVCDDNFMIGSSLETMINKYALLKTIDIEVEVFESGEEMLSYMKIEGTFDLIFLDIEFPKMNGVEIGNYIRNEMRNEVTQIVYISSMQTHAMELFEVRPMNFLIKPLAEEKINAILTKALELSQKQGKLFTYKKGWDEKKVLVSDILYFESIRRELRMVTANETVIFYSTLTEVYKEVQNNRFFYPHKSYLVNYGQVVHFAYDMLTMSNGEKIAIAQPRRKEVRQLQSKFEAQESGGII